MCPKVQQLVRNEVFDARRFPGVPLGGGKSDLSDASKIIHLVLADAPNTAWSLPTDGLHGLEGQRIVQVAMMLAFGFDKAPGWFNLPGWSLAKAHAALGPVEPELNGADSNGGGAPHVDDYMTIVTDLGTVGP